MHYLRLKHNKAVFECERTKERIEKGPKPMLSRYDLHKKKKKDEPKRN